MTISRFLRLVLAGLIIATVAAAAQDSHKDYPSRQVNFVVPFAPGGGTDIIGRLIAQKLTERFGKQFVIENRPGAGTVTAAVQVSKSMPDGHTIMMATSGTMAMNPTLYKSLPYHPGQDLVLAALICHVPFVLLVNNDLPVKSVADLVKLAKERPLSYGSGGVGAFHHILGELFNAQFGTKIAHVPYRGTLPALNDLLAGHIQVLFADLAPAYPQVQAGKVRALGVSTARRVGSAPELAPLSEAGMPGFDWSAWQAVAVPAGVPQAVRDRLNGAIDAAVAAPEVQKQLVNLQFIPVGKTPPAELDRFVESETVRWAKVLQQAGVAGTQ